MTSASALESRHMVPRWRDSRTTSALGELDPYQRGDSSRVIPSVDRDYLQLKLDEWAANPTVSFASDAVAVGMALGLYQETTHAAQFLLDSNVNAPSPAIGLASSVLQLANRPGSDFKPQELDSETPDHGLEVRRLRRRIRVDPRNAIAWVDMARNYAALGQNGQAENAIGVALKIAPENRFVVRSASRLHLSVGDLGKAHDLVRRSPLLADDPWIMASEIALAQLTRKHPTSIRTARRMLRNDNHSNFQLSELAGALATLELGAGSTSNARRLFRRSLVDPNDNAVAQANWASNQLDDVGVEPRHFELPRAHEARGVMYYMAEEWSLAAAATEQWTIDEPFSTRPLTLWSFIRGTILEDHASAITKLDAALRIHPNDTSLLNNLIFSLAELGETARAIEESKQLKIDPTNDFSHVSVPATLGMIKYITGEPEAGFDLYERAKAAASGQFPKWSRAYAVVFHALQEAKLGTERSEAITAEADDLAREFHDPALRIVADRAINSLKQVRHAG